MKQVTAWFVVGDAVNVESWTAPVVDTQIKSGGRAVVLLRESQGGRVVKCVQLGRCDRIETEDVDG